MHHLKVGFIGAGNMAEAIVSGLIAHGHAADTIMLSDINAERLKDMQERFGVQTTQDNAALTAFSETLVLAVKPQQMRTILQALPVIPATITMISIAAGQTVTTIKEALGQNDISLIRVMPNTPALLGAGMSVMYADVDDLHRQRADYLFACVGESAWVEKESQMNAVTAISGSGPAYFFLLAEMMQGAGASMGLPAELAEKLAAQTALGAGRMLKESGRNAADLRAQVTSPGGTTQAALDCMFEKGVAEALRAGIQAAERRSRELA